MTNLRFNIVHEVIRWIKTRLIRTAVQVRRRARSILRRPCLIGSIINIITWLFATILKCMLQTKPVPNLVNGYVVELGRDFARIVGPHDAAIEEDIVLGGVGNGELALSTRGHTCDEEQIEVLVGSLPQGGSELLFGFTSSWTDGIGPVIVNGSSGVHQLE
jgi:hypothetical protein